MFQGRPFLGTGNTFPDCLHAIAVEIHMALDGHYMKIPEIFTPDFQISELLIESQQGACS